MASSGGFARAIVSLGSNIEPRSEYLHRALEELAKLPLTHLVATTLVMETEPVDVPEEFSHLKFLNQLAVLESKLTALDFSRQMHAIEDRLGRVRTVKNGPRTIDIDLLDFDGVVMNTPELTLPHPRAFERAFIQQQLSELAPVIG